MKSLIVLLVSLTLVGCTASQAEITRRQVLRDGMDNSIRQPEADWDAKVLPTLTPLQASEGQKAWADFHGLAADDRAKDAAEQQPSLLESLFGSKSTTQP